MCASFSIDIFAPGEHMHVTLLIIPLQAAIRAPVEAVGLKLDLFHLKDQICPVTQNPKVTSHKVQRNLRYKCSAVEIYKYQGGKERLSASHLEKCRDSTLILYISGQRIVRSEWVFKRFLL